jgi:hypothetical protein
VIQVTAIEVTAIEVTAIEPFRRAAIRRPLRESARGTAGFPLSGARRALHASGAEPGAPPGFVEFDPCSARS